MSCEGTAGTPYLVDHPYLVAGHVATNALADPVPCFCSWCATWRGNNPGPATDAARDRIAGAMRAAFGHDLGDATA